MSVMQAVAGLSRYWTFLDYGVILTPADVTFSFSGGLFTDTFSEGPFVSNYLVTVSVGPCALQAFACFNSQIDQRAEGFLSSGIRGSLPRFPGFTHLARHPAPFLRK
jgi:hypothetical protein